MIDAILLDSLYKNRLTELRELAESSNFSKSGSVEVLRARLIKCMVLSNLDLYCTDLIDRGQVVIH